MSRPTLAASMGESLALAMALYHTVHDHPYPFIATKTLEADLATLVSRLMGLQERFWHAESLPAIARESDNKRKEDVQ